MIPGRLWLLGLLARQAPDTWTKIASLPPDAQEAISECEGLVEVLDAWVRLTLAGYQAADSALLDFARSHGADLEEVEAWTKEMPTAGLVAIMIMSAIELSIRDGHHPGWLLQQAARNASSPMTLAAIQAERAKRSAA